jgi:hypothetical protein
MREKVPEYESFHGPEYNPTVVDGTPTGRALFHGELFQYS